jgi:DNA-directed RNA polymerase specialized sigma24 family protein
MDAEEFFAGSWLELAPRLRAMLARAGAPTAERDDLVQETALRLFGMWDRVDPALPIEPLARRIAMNAWRDQWRRRGEREVLGDVPELATGSDTERAALAKVEVGEVSRALWTLPVSTAQVLRIAATESERGDAHLAATPALRMARTRARRALLACLKVASAAVLATIAGIRSLTRPATTATAVGAIAAIAFVLALTVPGPATAPTIGRQAPTAPAAATELTAATANSTPTTLTHSPISTKAHRAARPATSPTPYYIVNVGPADVGVFADLNVEGHGVRLAKPEPGNQRATSSQAFGFTIDNDGAAAEDPANSGPATAGGRVFAVGCVGTAWLRTDYIVRVAPVVSLSGSDKAPLIPRALSSARRCLSP